VRTSELFAQFKRERQYLNNVTPKTLEWYETSWKKFGPVIGDATNEGELAQKIKQVQIAMSSQGNLSPHTINTYSRPIQTFSNWLLEGGQITRKLKLARLKTPTTVLRTLSDEEMTRLIKFVPRTRNQRRMHAATVLMLDTGARANEWMSLKCEDIDLDNLTVRVMGKGRKERVIPISVECRKVLMRWIVRDVPEKAQVIFCSKKGTRIGHRNALRDVKRLGARCGIWKIGLHYCRHSFASAFMRNGGSITDLQRILGHADLRVTVRYVHSLVADLKVATQRFSPIARLA
jgi:site-specific recombinase XerD